MNKDLIEKLSDYEHDRWSRWQNYVFNVSLKNKDGSITIPKYYVDRWQRQINTLYKDLTESEKDSDRKEAIRIVDIINED